eukprot:scaffold61522_cov47-Phaeocystis_antarctica.AAC.1
MRVTSRATPSGTETGAREPRVKMVTRSSVACWSYLVRVRVGVRVRVWVWVRVRIRDRVRVRVRVRVRDRVPSRAG